jgi:hypothetical protein
VAEVTLNAVAGLTAAVAAGPIAELLGIDAVAVVRSVGLVLVLWAVAVALVVRYREHWWRSLTSAAVVANVAWIVGSAILVATAVFEPGGIALVALVAVAVGALAWMQLRALRATAAR